MSGPLKALSSLGKVAWQSLSLAGRIVLLLLRGKTYEAGEHTRFLGMVLHDDLLTLIVALQRARAGGARLPQTVDRVLVVKLDRVGDMVNTTPVFDAVQARFPGALIDVVGHPGPLSMLEADPRVSQRIAYKSSLYHPLPIRLPGPSAWRLVSQLMKRHYDLVIYLRGSFPFLLLGLTAPMAAAKFVEGEPVVRRYVKALEPFFGSLEASRPKVIVTDQARRDARARFSPLQGSDRPQVVIHATASTEVKQWPADRFARVADELHRTFDADVHFIGTPQERKTLDRIVSLSAHPHTVNTDLSLERVTAAIAVADLFIGNDSGLSHIAAAVNTPSVVIWGAANLSMARPVAPPDRCVIVYRDLPCRAVCPEIRCVNDTFMQCLSDIEPQAVLSAAGDLLRPRVAFAGSAAVRRGVAS